MSHIPNSAMPHAVETAEPDGQQKDGRQSLSQTISDGASKLADMARANPKTAAAAGAAVLAGAVAAAAIPMMRSGGTAKKSSGKSAKSS